MRRLAATICGLAALSLTACHTQSSSSRVVTVALPGRPSAVAFASGLVWVADDGRGVVVTVDARRGKVVGLPIRVGPSPIGLAAGAGAVWVADASGTVTAIDTSTRRVKGPSVRIGAALSGIATGAGAVWVTDIERGILWRVDPSDRTTLPTNVPMGVVRAAVFDGKVWVTNSDATVTVVNATTLSVENTMTVGNGPIGLAPAGGAMWVANSDDDTVSAVDPGGPTRFPPVHVGKGPVAVAAGADGVWVASQDDEVLTRLDPTSGRRFGAPVALHSRPRAAAIGSGRVWVVGVEASVLVGVPV
jgi:YVTN family beta-propeller protein